MPDRPDPDEPAPRTTLATAAASAAVGTGRVTPRWRDYARAVLVVAACTGLAALMHGRFERSNLVMVYLLGVMWAAVSCGRGPAVLASILSVATFDFFFVPPNLTFVVSDPQYLVTFVVMLVAAVLIGTLAARLQAQVRAARIDERRSRALVRLSGELVALQDLDGILDAALRHLEDVFESRAAVLLPDDAGRLAIAAGDPLLLGAGAHERGVAQWAFDAGQPAGLGTATLPDSRALYLPLRGSATELGVLAIVPRDVRRLTAPETFRLLQAFANHAALALERSKLAVDAERARLQGEAERMRSALLSSVSHDLRTPLAVITGVTSTLLEQDDDAPATERRELLRTAAEEAARLNRLVANLLSMTRLDSGTLEVKRSWHSLEDLVGAALRRVDPVAAGREVRIELPADLPLVPVDDVLIEQVLFNLVENALKHAASDDPITIRARARTSDVEVAVEDRGPGLPRGGGKPLFEKFHRGDASHRTGGVGLGLAICRGIVEAHGGTIHADDRVGGGARFAFTLPLGAGAPAIEAETNALQPGRAGDA